MVRSLGGLGDTGRVHESFALAERMIHDYEVKAISETGSRIRLLAMTFVAARAVFLGVDPYTMRGILRSEEVVRLAI